MIDHIVNNTIVASYPWYPSEVDIDGVTYRIRDLHDAGHSVESLGFFVREKQLVLLDESQIITGYTLEVIGGRSVEVPIVHTKSSEEIAAEQQAELEEWRANASVRPATARIALIMAGKESYVETFMSSLPEPQQTIARTRWEYELSIKYGDPLIQTLISSGIMTIEEMDQLFKLAETL